MKKFVCSVCGYVHEGDSAPEFCPQCKAPAAKFVEKVENGEKLSWATEHHVGDGKVEDKEVLEGLRAHFTGECTEVGMYLAMSRQAEREGYPEVAEAYKRIAFEEAEHAAKFGELLGEVVAPCTKTNLKCVLKRNMVPAPASSTSPNAQKNSATMPSMTPFMKWRKMKPVTEPLLKVF